MKTLATNQADIYLIFRIMNNGLVWHNARKFEFVGRNEQTMERVTQ